MSFGSKRWPMVATTVAFCALGLSFAVEALSPRWNGDRLQVAAPGIHFLTGRALERLHDGADVSFAFQLTLSTIPRSVPLERALDRFIVSYDVWGETFKVVEARPPRRTVTHLAAGAAEAWCIDHMGVPALGAPNDKDLWLRLEIRAEQAPPRLMTDSGLSLRSLIELFNGAAPPATQQWSAETGPFRLHDVKR